NNGVSLVDCIDLGLRVCHCWWSETEVEITQPAYHPGLHGTGFRYRLCRWFGEWKYGEGARRGVAVLDDVRNRSSAWVRTVEQLAREVKWPSRGRFASWPLGFRVEQNFNR